MTSEQERVARAEEVLPELVNWFESKNLGSADVTFLCLRFLAGHFSHMAEDRRNLSEGLKWASGVLDDWATKLFVAYRLGGRLQ
jgi:hypothetical protein